MLLPYVMRFPVSYLNYPTPEGEMEGDSESEAQWDIASSNRTGIGNPQGHHQEMPGCRGSSNATVPGGSHGVII